MTVPIETASRSALAAPGSRLGLILCFLIHFSDAGFCRSPRQTSSLSGAGSAYRGEALFTGKTSFQNGGPPCATCHSIAGLPFPGGGSLGPELSGAYRKLGSEGTDSALQTLFFNAMTPIYDPRPLTPQERSDLKEFLRDAGNWRHATPATPWIVVIALGGCGVLLGLTQILWRDRARSVRKNLLRRAKGGGGAP